MPFQPKHYFFDEYEFPTPLPPDELVAIGGPLTPARVEAAYRRGIFPWPHEDCPLLWFSPDPRFVIPLQEFHIPDSLKRIHRKGDFHYTVNQCFPDVIRACQTAPRPEQDGTWITPEIIETYEQLHEQSIVHSVETWHGDELVGGLYGVQVGKIFSGESMFTNVSNAGKCAMIHLSEWLRAQHVEIIDCQMETPLMQQFGGRFIPRKTFLQHLQHNH